MQEAMALQGNPSSIHAEGRAARAVIEDARAAVAAAIGAKPSEIVFTSGGTEAANTVISAYDRVAYLATEHACVRDPALMKRGTALPVGRDGVLDMRAMEAAWAGTDRPPALIAIHAANNETGVLQPVADVHAAQAVVLCDAVQLVAREPFDVTALGVTYAFISAHKFGGPKGVGALYVRDGMPVAPLIRGGGQERRWRSGTENVAGIAGMAAAVKAAVADGEAFRERAIRWQRTIEETVRAHAPDAVIFGEHAPRLANTTCFAVPRLRAEMLLIAFDLAGVAVSSGSACSSGKVEPSHVLAAMGFTPDVSGGAIRVSTGWATTDDDVGRFCEAFAKICAKRPAKAA